jgi:hypothetical protein
MGATNLFRAFRGLNTLTIKKFLGVFLSWAIAVPSSAAPTAMGVVKGHVSVSGRVLQGLSLTLVNIETGRIFAVRTSADGSYTASVPAGSYVFSSPGFSGVAIARAPLSIEVASGKVASANVEMTSLAVQAQDAPATGTATITHDAANCITEGEFTLIEATFAPLTSVVNGRLYFQSNLSPEWFYTEFEKIEPPVAGGATHRAFIPKVNKDGGIETIVYYIQITSTDFNDTKSPENALKVVSGASECTGFPGAGGLGDGIGKLAPIGTPEGAVSVLSASGSAAGSLAGFGGVAGATLGAAAIAGIAGAVAIGGAVAAAAAGGGGAAPTPTPTPTTPTPTPTPTPIPPIGLCTISIVTVPDTVAPLGGRYCTVSISVNGAAFGNPVSGAGSFEVPCNASVVAFANVAAQSSTQGPLPANWSQACSGNAVGQSCSLGALGAPGSTRQLGLTCTPLP